MKKEKYKKMIKDAILYAIGIVILLFFWYPRNVSVNDLWTHSSIVDNQIRILLYIEKPVPAGPSFHVKVEIDETTDTAYLFPKISYNHFPFFTDGIDFGAIYLPAHIKTVIIKDNEGNEKQAFPALQAEDESIE